jgi:hypothetical protein
MLREFSAAELAAENLPADFEARRDRVAEGCT